MAYCNLQNPTVTTKDGREIESPLYSEIKKIVNPIDARITYNDIVSEDFKKQSFWTDIVSNGYVDEYGQPTIEGLLKYTDFGTRVSLSHYADNVKKELFDDGIEINSTSSLKSALFKIKEFNDKNNYYKAILVKTTEQNGFDLKIVRNSSKVSRFVNNVELFLDNISSIETDSNTKDLFSIVKKSYNIYKVDDSFNPNGILETLKSIKNKSASFEDFYSILPNLSSYSNPVGARVSKILLSNTDFVFDYLKEHSLINTDNEESARESVEKNIKKYSSLIKNHLLYMAYKDMALGDLITKHFENSEYISNLIQRLKEQLIKDLDSIKVPEQKEAETEEKIEEFSYNGSYFSNKAKDVAKNEQDIVRKLYYLEKDSSFRFKKIYGKSSAKGYNDRLKILNKIIDEGSTIGGLADYLDSVIKELKSLYKEVSLSDSLTEKAKLVKMLIDKCNEYENILEYFNVYTESNSFKEDFKEYLQSILTEIDYNKNIDEITNDDLDTIFGNDNVFFEDSSKKEEYRRLFVDYLTQDFELNGLTEFSRLVSRYKTSLTKTAINITAEFLERYQTEEGRTVAFGKNKGKTVDIMELLKKADGDINIYNKLFSAMADCPDTILRLTDKAAKQEKGKARLETLDLIRNLKKEALLLERSGVKGFSWMYSKDSNGNKTGFYVTKANKNEYNKIMSNPAKKRFYEYFMKVKNELDMMYPERAVTPNKIIGIRKDKIERFKSAKSIKGVKDELIEGIKDDYLNRSDDEDIAGYSELFTDASGNEVKMLPIYYNNFKEEDSENMSEDAVSTLAAYASKAIEYKHLNEIISFIELEKIALRERELPSTDGKLKVLNMFNRSQYKNDGSVLEDNVVYHKDNGTSNVYKMFDAWVDMQFYGRWRNREGSIGDTKISTSKVIDMFNKKTAIASMSLNLLNGISNVMTGVAQTRIETIVGSFAEGYVGVKDMAKADTEYTKNMMPFIAEIGNRTKSSKLALFSEMLNISQAYEEDISELNWRKDTWAKRLSMDSALSFIQKSGEHYMSHRMGLAIAIHTKLKDRNGNEKTLWDALKVVYLQEDGSYSSENKKLGGKLILDGEYTLNDKEFKFEGEDLYKLERKIAGINEKIHGIYNKQDANIIQKYAVGRLVYMFRKWIPAAIDKRFMDTQYNYDTEEWKEGYYRTVFDFLKQLWYEREGLKFNFMLKYKELTTEQQRNVIRALTESLQFYLTILIGKAIIPDDDDSEKQSWAFNMLKYQIIRLNSELAALTPVSLPYLKQNMISEALKLFKSPIAAANTMQDSYSILGLINPYCWFEDVKSGKYKDHSKAYKIIMSNRFWNPLGTLYYKNAHPEAFVGWYE